jgi:hypothetical protein
LSGASSHRAFSVNGQVALPVHDAEVEFWLLQDVQFGLFIQGQLSTFQVHIFGVGVGLGGTGVGSGSGIIRGVGKHELSHTWKG